MIFYLKIAICDAQGNDIVVNSLTPMLTLREVVAARMLPAHVANTYASLAIFMSRASWAVNVMDLLTTFSRVPSESE